MKYVDYASVTKDNNGIPVLHCLLKDNKIIKDGKHVVLREGWLAPFRGYRFQVSGSIDGKGDYGSSPVIGLKNCICESISDVIGYQSNYDNVGVSKAIILGQIMIALLEWTKSDADLGHFNVTSLNAFDNMAEFVDDCYNWIVGL